jgi:hypothetical protein
MGHAKAGGLHPAHRGRPPTPACLLLPPRKQCHRLPGTSGPCRPRALLADQAAPLLSHVSPAAASDSFPHFFLCLSAKVTGAPSLILPCVRTPPPSRAPPMPQIVSPSTPFPLSTSPATKAAPSHRHLPRCHHHHLVTVSPYMHTFLH